MPTIDDLENFRLAHSYLDKARRELAHWQKVLDSRDRGLSHFDTIKASYDGHVRHAERIVDRMRADFERRRAPAERKLKEAKGRLRRFHKGLETGKIDPKKTNERHRAIQTERQEQENTLDIIERVASAETADDLGGFEDLPLDEYRERLDKLGERPARKLSEIELTTGQTAIGFAVVGLLAAAFYYFVYLAPSATFTAVAAGDDGHVIQVACRNTGRSPINIYVPWPDGIPQPPRSESPARGAFGVRVFVIEEGYANLKLLSDSSDAWFQRGAAIPPDTAIGISPGRIATFSLNANRLAASGLNISAVRVVFTRAGGKELGRFDINLEDTT